VEAGSEAGEDAVVVADADVTHCSLGDGSDPVALCTQKTVLKAMHGKAFDAKAGVATSWSPTTGLADVSDGGARLHVWTDDVGYGSAIAAYLASAAEYGDTQITAALEADLTALVPIVEKELTPLPDGYSGEPYQRLQAMAGGLRTIDDVSDGNAIGAIADAYGRAAYTSYFFSLASAACDAGADASVKGDAGHGPADAGKDATTGGPDAAKDATLGASDAAKDAAKSPSDATVDGAEAALPEVDGVFGRPTGTSGVYAYVTADVATAAYAMLDLAVRDAADAGPSQGIKWQLAARSAFDHLYNRARDPVSGLYRTALITSGGCGPDALDTSTANPGLLLTDTTATVALALTRARDLVNVNSSALGVLQTYPFGDRIADALASLNYAAAGLYDGPAIDAGTAPTGFMEGYQAGQGVVTSKPTRPNAFLYAVLQRQFLTVWTPWLGEIEPLAATLISSSTANTSLFSVVAGQQAFFGACSRDFQPLGADAGPDADSYQSAANVAFVEAMNMMLPAQ
jgi:hypothetical protein